MRAEKTLITQQVVVNRSSPGVALTLSTEEAVFLRDVMACIGGSAANTRRRHADALISALGSVGIDPSPGAPNTCQPADIVGHPAIYFKESE
jgi:hypothetical protein